jgi:hypothetical protein
MARATSLPLNNRSELRTVHLKDEVLDSIAEHANVAQFVSFDPDLKQRYARVYGKPRGYVFDSPLKAVTGLLESSLEKSVNIRTFGYGDSRSGDFIRGLTRAEDVLSALLQLSSRGLHTIVNESIDINDGGVSGVSCGDIVEFCPGDTPRCVEHADVASLPKQIAWGVLKRVYGFVPKLDNDIRKRIEFSVHPTMRGFAREHTIIWEIEESSVQSFSHKVRWPNSFSKYLGDKLFGLIIADVLGFAVPATLALARKVSPFKFGRPTKASTGIVWIRTCPAIKTPGKFTTSRGWKDPFAIMQAEDPGGDLISSILVQDEVEARYSGAFLSSSSGHPVIEGVSGTGETLMLGIEGPTDLPTRILHDIHVLYAEIDRLLGPVRVEWVHDGQEPWLVQVQQESTYGFEDVIVPADNHTTEYVEFRVSDGLPKLRELVRDLAGTGKGIMLRGHVGLTSHLADILREARIPSKRAVPEERRLQTQISFFGAPKDCWGGAREKL